MHRWQTFHEEYHVAYTYEELKHKTIADLRDIAKEVQDDAVKGYSQMNKDHLLPALCNALGIESHEHHAVTGIDKAAIKAKMRDLKKQRASLLESHDHQSLKSVRRHLHHLNHQIRAHMS
jgi:DNA-binding IclR family transcriptional regulator